MNPQLWKRLDKIERSLTPVQNKVLFIPLKGESDEEYDARIARWKSGEKVEGIDQMYTGQEVGIIRIKFVSAKKRDTQPAN